MTSIKAPPKVALLILISFLALRATLGEGERKGNAAEANFFADIQFIGLYETVEPKRCVLSCGDSAMIFTQRQFIPTASENADKRFFVVIVGGGDGKIYRGIDNFDERMDSVSDWAKPIEGKTIIEMIEVTMSRKFKSAESQK